MLFRIKENKLVLFEIIDNPLIDINIEADFKEKSAFLISYLKNFKVNVIVAQNFSEKIETASFDFIPVLTDFKNIDEAIHSIEKKIPWLQDELFNQPKKHKLFYINSGIMKLKTKESGKLKRKFS